MRFRHRDGSTVHVGYCATVHPAEDLDGVIAGLDGCAALVRAELDVPVLGVGLWYASPLADRLANSPPSLNKLRRTLARNQLEVVTLNGIPHSHFTDQVVGTKLFCPDWTEPERLRYTFDLIGVLAELLPADASYGSVSTLPLAWRMPWSKARNTAARDAFETLWQAGVDVVKGQVAVAPTLVDPSDAVGRHALNQLGTPKYLRQVREWGGPGVDDVAQAYELSGHAAWRMHTHLPAHTAPPAPLTATTLVLEDCLARLVRGGHPLTHHLESEVFAWPRSARTKQRLAKRIAKELRWLGDRLTDLGLEAVH